MTTDKATPEAEVNIEEIMQQIREQVLAKRAALWPDAGPPIRARGKRLPPEFYEHLYQAGLAYDEIKIGSLVRDSRIPIVGSLLHWLRSRMHELVIFYVNQFAARQIAVNRHLLQALSILSDELEEWSDEDEGGE